MYAQAGLHTTLALSLGQRHMAQNNQLTMHCIQALNIFSGSAIRDQIYSIHLGIRRKFSQGLMNAKIL